MNTNLINEIAAHIRRVDGDNKMPPHRLGHCIAVSRFLDGRGDIDIDVFIDFVERTNPDKSLGAGALAELIVAEFSLDEEPS